MPRQFDVIIERDAEGFYVASVPQIPGCHTQARSLDEVNDRIREAIEVALEAEGVPDRDLEFVGIQRVTVAALSRTPRVTGTEVIAACGKAGFSVLRVKGSHRLLRHEDSRSRSWPRMPAKPYRNCSLCEAISFAVLDARRIRRAFTFDRHFLQYGRIEILGLSR